MTHSVDRGYDQHDEQSRAPGDASCDIADLRVQVPAAATELAPLRRAITEWAQRTPLHPEQIDAVRLASYEAAANVVEHAYSNGAGSLNLEASCSIRRRAVTVAVADKGRWRPATVDPRSSRGRGLPLIRALSDDVEITTGAAGTTVRMRWNLDPEQQSQLTARSVASGRSGTPQAKGWRPQTTGSPPPDADRSGLR